MPIISASNKGGTSVDSSDWLTKKKQAILRGSQSQKGPYTQIDNKSFGSDTVSSLVWKNCVEACPNGVSGGNPPLATGTMTFSTIDSTLVEIYCESSTDITTLVTGSNSASIAIYDNGSGEYDIAIDNITALTEYTISGLESLTYIEFYSSNLKTLNVTGLKNLENLNCGNNQLTSLNVTGLTTLEMLYCGNNQLTSLDVTGLTTLKTLYCDGNQLTSLDVTGLTDLNYLNCENNLFPNQETINTIVSKLPRNNSGTDYICPILNQGPNTFVQPPTIPTGWVIS